MDFLKNDFQFRILYLVTVSEENIIFRIFHLLLLSQENEGVNHERRKQGIQTKRDTTVQRASITQPSPDRSGGMGREEKIHN